MDTLDNIFSNDNEIVEKLKGFSIKPDYNKIFFEHLGPELKKLFVNNKDKIILKNFIEAASYEYGFFNREIDLKKAFSLYKKYADINDYFCMYKMHVIYLCEYEKFNIPFNRILERIYLLKCFAYLPNYIYDLRLELFELIDIIYELALILVLEDETFEKHEIFFDLLINEREKYNLTLNDINLMKGCLFCYFRKKEDDQDFNLLLYSILNSIMPNKDLDYVYYNAKNKCVYFRDYLDLKNIMSDSEVETFYKEIKEKKMYEFYEDYGNYLLDEKIKSNPEIIEIFTISCDNGYLFSNFRAYQCIIDYYDFDDIMSDYDKITILFVYLLNQIVFERLSLGQFILFMGLLIKYSKFKEKIISNYLIYVKEINDYISSKVNEKEKSEDLIIEKGKDEFFLFIKAYIYYYGFKGVEEQNLQKAIEYLDKGIKITKKNWVKKINEFIKYNIKKLMFNHKLISEDDLIKAKKYLVEFYSKNLNLKYEIIDCYILGKDYYEGITRQKDEYLAITIYKSILDHFCGNIFTCPFLSETKKFLKNHESKMENKLIDETCCICYDKKVNKMFVPCKHYFCSICIGKLEKDSKCPICRSDILCII